MAARTRHSQLWKRSFGLALGAALALATSARADDVTIQLDAGSGFAILHGGERLRVDGPTGNVSRNGVLFVHTTGTNNTFVGSGAGNLATTGPNNSAFGQDALRYNTAGFANSAFGFQTLRANTTGFNNNAVGFKALYANTGGSYNSAFGFRALAANTTGTQNLAFGTRAMELTTTGTHNSAFGDFALRRTTTGSRNLGLGYYAGASQTTGSDNIYLANTGVAGENGQIKIGTSGTHTQTRIAAIRGVTTGMANAIAVLIDSTGQLGTVSSSRSVKKEIRDMGDATARLLELRPVTFRYKEQTLPSGGEVPPEYGLIAEEVAEIFPDLVVYDEAGLPFTVKYHVMAPMLLNEMKKQQRTIVRLEAQQQSIEAQQQEIAALTSRLAQVESRVSGAPGVAQR